MKDLFQSQISKETACLTLYNNLYIAIGAPKTFGKN
jgi:hypothetical protein